MPPQQRQTHVQQLQEAKAEISQLRMQLDNLSNVENDLREANAEKDNYRNMLEQAKAQLNANTAKTRVVDLEGQVQQLSVQLRRAKEESGAAAAMVNAYEAKLASVSGLEQQTTAAQNNLRHAIEERDGLASQIRNVQAAAREAIEKAEASSGALNARLRTALENNANYEAVIRDLRLLLRSQPDVLAAVKQKLGIG